MLSIEEVLKKEIVYKIDNMDNVNIQKDIVYKAIYKEELLMDLYTPFSNSEKEKLPVVILVHGEAKSVNFKETGQYISYGRLVAAYGFNAVTFNHRVLSDGFNIEEVNSDIDGLIKYLSSNAHNLNIDKDKIAIWCFSGGVPFGLYAGMHSNLKNIKGVIAYYGFGDFTYIGKMSYFNMQNEQVEKYSPINFINGNLNRIPPLFIARAGLDSHIINESLDKFVVKALKNNLNINIYNHATGGHGFDLFNDDDRTCEIIEESLNFLRRNFK